MSNPAKLTFEYSSSDSVDERFTSDRMLCNGFRVGNDTSLANESNIRICCWTVVGEDSERICSILHFDGNMLHKSVGLVQYRERCMLSDRPSLKLPVPHFGQVVIKNTTTTNSR